MADDPGGGSGPGAVDIEDASPPVTEPRPPSVGRLAAWWLVAAGLTSGLLWAATDHMLRATLSLAGSCLLGAGLRALLDRDRAGGLVARGKWIDVATLATFGVAIGVAGLALDLRARV